MKLYAFWKYDGYPFVLGGPVKSIKSDRVTPENYGGYTFKHIHVTDIDSGYNIKEKLDKLTIEYENEKVNLAKKYNALVKEVAPFIIL